MSIAKKAAVCGVLLQLTPVVGMTVIVVTLVRESVVAWRTHFRPDFELPASFDRDLHIGFILTMGGMALAMIGGIITLLVLIGLEYRERWFCVAMWIFVILNPLFFFPMGVIWSLLVIVYLLRHKSEFRSVNNVL